MSRYNIDFGKSSEDRACLYLREQGYKILERNYKTSYAEIDIIAKHEAAVCFIEVKSRSSAEFGFPEEAVSRIKQRKIIQGAITYLKKNKLLDSKVRFDVLGISSEVPGEDGGIKLIKNAFTLDGNYCY